MPSKGDNYLIVRTGRQQTFNVIKRSHDHSARSKCFRYQRRSKSSAQGRYDVKKEKQQNETTFASYLTVAAVRNKALSNETLYLLIRNSRTLLDQLPARINYPDDTCASPRRQTVVETRRARRFAFDFRLSSCEFARKTREFGDGRISQSLSLSLIVD